jgi:hypothetical protein
MITTDDLREYVGDSQASETDLGRALSTGAALVDVLIGSVSDIPDAVVDQAYLVAGSEVFARKSAPLGVSQFATPDGAAIRVNRDPLTAVYPLLTPYLGWGIA